jgi:hypothetical protein
MEHFSTSILQDYQVTISGDIEAIQSILNDSQTISKGAYTD